MAGLSKKKAEKLRPLLEALAESASLAARVGFDPVEFPRRYGDLRDAEVVAFLSASFAYGRADLFRPKVEFLLSQLGQSPAVRLKHLTLEEASSFLQGFVYRFNVAADAAVLLLGLGAVLRNFESLEAVFLSHFDGQDVKRALQGMTKTILNAAPKAEIEQKLGPVRGVAHLLPIADGAGASKRLNMFLRWMVRGPDSVDLGIWKKVKPENLVIPLDTHIARMAWNLGLTTRKTQTWPTAVEITESLRRVDAADPVQFDFALCHFGMSGRCPAKVRKENCRACVLRAECRVGRSRSLRPPRSP